MEGAFHLTRCSGHAAAAIGIVGAVQFGDVAVGIFHHAVLVTPDDICALEANFLAGCQTEKFLWRILHEIIALDEDFTGEWHAVGACFRILGVVLHFHSLGLPHGVIVDNHLHGIDHGHGAGGYGVEILADGVFEK